MDLACNLLGLLAALGLGFAFSGMETAIYRTSRVRMRIRAGKGEPRAGAVLRLLDDIDGMVTTILIDSNVITYAATYFVISQLALWGVSRIELISTALVTPLFFVLTESLPKQLAYAHADDWSLALVRVFRAFRLVLTPAIWVLNRAVWLFQLFLPHGKGENISRSQREILMEHFSAGVAGNVVSEEQDRMARRIMEFEKISVAECMIPLSRMLVIPGTETRGQAAARMASHDARGALLADARGRPDGRLVTMAALILSPGPATEGVRDVAEKLDSIRADAAIPEVLNLFRSRHNRTALVVERGRITGLINTRGVLDKIAGIEVRARV